jgi:hypothetical protein
VNMKVNMMKNNNSADDKVMSDSDYNSNSDSEYDEK